MANEIKLTMVGDAAPAVRAFDQVGNAARDMEGDVRQSADGFERAGEAADNVDTKAMGFRDTLTGLQDGFAGIKKVNEDGLGFESLLLLGFGVGDLASGFYNFLIPALKASKVATIAQAVASNVASGATKAWAFSHKLLSMAFLTSPIGWIVLAIAALIAVIVLIATKTTWFQSIWRETWGFLKAVGKWFAGPFADFFVKGFRLAMAPGLKAWGWFRDLPGKMRGALSGLGRIISAPFRTAFNWISDAWNNTVGRLHWSVPGWVPGIGGNSVGAPTLPKFHSGGVVPGLPGQEVLAVLQSGERVSANGQGGQGALIVSAAPGADRLLRAIVAALLFEIRTDPGTARQFAQALA